MIKNGALVISLDFELYWGILDQKRINHYEKNLNGVKRAIEKTLNLFDKYDIHATWATVGFLFAQHIDELKLFFPQEKPNYHHSSLNPYNYINNTTSLKKDYHFAPQLIEKIKSHNGIL